MTMTVVRALRGAGSASGDGSPDALGFSRPCALCLAVIRRCAFVKKVVFTTGDGACVSELRREQMLEGHLSYSQRVVAAQALEAR